MTTGTPVVVSRIQNRRGTQQQFDGYVYSLAGPNSVYPLGYDGIDGYGSFPNFTIQNYPNVLMPGELALCTDSHRIFIGNVDGKFSEILVGLQDTDLTRLRPDVIYLQPTITPTPQFTTAPVAPYPWVKIDQLTVGTAVGSFTPTPFLSFLYSVTDSLLGNPSSSGVNFARNGELIITSLATNVTLVDTGTSINIAPDVVSPIQDPLTSLYPSGPPDINFKAVYESGRITVWYMHDFPGTLTLGIDAITWLPL